MTQVDAGLLFIMHHHHPLLRCFFRGLLFVMAVIADKFYLHVTAVPKSIGIERRPFSAAVLDQLPSLVGDQSGHAQAEITRRYFRDLSFVIAADDNFNNKGWPVTSVINDRWFRGALVVLIERNRDPAGRPFIGETFLDGLTAEECKVASSHLGFPPGGGPKFPYPPRPAKKRRDRGVSSVDQP
jgi:hypothetical protein